MIISEVKLETFNEFNKKRIVNCLLYFLWIFNVKRK